MPSPGNDLAGRQDFIFIGEHAAIDFVNTRVVADGNIQELFLSWADVMDWLCQAKLTTRESVDLREAARAGAPGRIIEFRQRWEEALADFIAKRRVSDAFLDRLNALLVPDTFHEVLRRDGRKVFRVVRSASRLQGEKLALGLIAHQVACFLAEANPGYVHRCANTASCVLYFYDTTKNHRRQWCSVTTCGNRHKVAQFRKRQAQAEKAS